MQGRRVKLVKEELERIIELCESIEKSGVDPFSVNIKELLQRLRSILESSDNLEVIVLDAETLYRISVVIALQHRWLAERASNLFVDPQIVSAKILAADSKSLAQALASSWRPIVSGEQLTRRMIIEGMEYFLSLPPRGGKAGKSSFKDSPASDELLTRYEVLQDELLEQRMKELHLELLNEEQGERGVSYWSFIAKEGEGKKLERAYVLSFLISEGFADLKRDPITGELWIIPYREKMERREPASIAVTIKRVE